MEQLKSGSATIGGPVLLGCEMRRNVVDPSRPGWVPVLFKSAVERGVKAQQFRGGPKSKKGRPRDG